MSRWSARAYRPSLLAYSTIGLMLAIFAILIYLWFRFEWQFALGAMVANVHDLVLTIGFMSLTQIDFDLSSIAALLTILGYSLNDTVVIYDRIREMLRRYKKMPMPDLLNVSVNSTLSRSIITHVTVTLALLALLFFGGHAIHSFVATMMFGVVLVGTYTSVFIAAPDPDLSRRRRDARRRRRGAGADAYTGGHAGEHDAPARRRGRGGPELGRRRHPAPASWRRSRPTARAASVLPACRTAARCLCLPSGIWAWPVDAGRAISTKPRWRRCSPLRPRSVCS